MASRVSLPSTLSSAVPSQSLSSFLPPAQTVLPTVSAKPSPPQTQAPQLVPSFLPSANTTLQRSGEGVTFSNASPSNTFPSNTLQSNMTPFNTPSSNTTPTASTASFMPAISSASSVNPMTIPKSANPPLYGIFTPASTSTTPTTFTPATISTPVSQVSSVGTPVTMSGRSVSVGKVTKSGILQTPQAQQPTPSIQLPQTTQIPTATTIPAATTPAPTTIIPVIATIDVTTATDTTPTTPAWGIQFNAASIAVLIIVPIIVWVSLYYYAPNFICDLHHEKGKTVNTTKLLSWTLAITIVILIAIWLASKARSRR